MKAPLLYVIAGGPCTGKTTLISALKAKNYPVIPEAARSIIEENLAKGITVEELMSDVTLFQKNVFYLQMNNERNAIKRFESDSITSVFLDRGILDGIAYLKYYGKKSDFISSHITAGRYTKVFLLDPVPYVSDTSRIEDPVKAKEIHEGISKVYLDSPYVVVRVPPISVEERINFVLSNLT